MCVFEEPGPTPVISPGQCWPRATTSPLRERFCWKMHRSKQTGPEQEGAGRRPDGGERRRRGGDGTRSRGPRRGREPPRPAETPGLLRRSRAQNTRHLWVCCAQRCFGRNPTQFPPRVPTVERKTTCFYFSLRLRHDLPQIGPGCWRHECPRPRNQGRPAWRGSEGRTSRRQGRPHRKRFLTKLLFLLSFLKNKIFKNSLAP